MKKIIISTLLFKTTLELATVDSHELFQKLTQKIKNLNNCDLTKIWPDYKWQRNIDYFIFSSQVMQQTYLFDYQSLTEVPFRYEETLRFAFLAIYRNKTVLEASKHLGITQTGVTQRIRSLEKKLGSTLFIRSRKGMTLTDSGAKLLRYCRQKESLENSIVSEIKDEGLNSPIRIQFAGSTYFMQSRVLPIAQKLRQSFPSLYLSFHINDNDNKIALLKKSEADFIFLPRDQVPLELDSKLLKKSTYVLVGGATSKKEKNDLNIIDFSPYYTFTSNFFKQFKINFSEGKKRHYINNTLMLPALLEQNIGVAVLDLEHFNSAKKSDQKTSNLRYLSLLKVLG